MTVPDLDAIRAQIDARIARRRIIDQRFAALEADIAAGAAAGVATVVARCDQPGHKGRRAKLAELLVTRHGAIFCSKIERLPSDQLNLRPWEREHYLGFGALGIRAGLDDDQFLLDWIEQLDSWGRGHQPTGKRWLAKAGPHIIGEVLDLPDAAGRLPLWTRCRDHPESAEELSVEALMAAARRA